MDNFEQMKELLNGSIEASSLEFIIDYLVHNEYNHVPLKKNKTSMFGKSIKNSFQGSTISNVLQNRLDVKKDHSIKWINLMLQYKYLKVEVGAEEAWSSKSIYTWAEKSKVKNSPTVETDKDTESEHDTISFRIDSEPKLVDEEKSSTDEKSITLEKKPVYFYFFEYLKKRYTCFVSEFLWEVKFFKQVEDNKKRSELAKNIYDTYILPKSKKFVKLPHNIRLLLREKISKASKKVFDKAEEAAIELLQKNPFNEFIEHKRYKKLLMKSEGKVRAPVVKFQYNLPFFAKYSDVLHEYFDILLSDPIKAQFFKEFLITEKNDENLNFYLSINKFASVNDKKNFAKEIYETFLVGTSKQSVNVPGKIMEAIKKDMEDPPSNLFTDAEKHVYKLMEKDPYHRFLKSPFFDKLVFFQYGGASKDGDIFLLLRKPERFEFFLYFLIEEFSPEKVEFCSAVDLYNESLKNDKINVQEEAQSIWDDFFAQKTYDLKLPDFVFKFLEFSVKNKKASTKTFDEARENLMDEFPTNCIEKFKKSKYLMYMLHSEEMKKKEGTLNN